MGDRYLVRRRQQCCTDAGGIKSFSRGGPCLLLKIEAATAAMVKHWFRRQGALSSAKGFGCHHSATLKGQRACSHTGMGPEQG